MDRVVEERARQALAYEHKPFRPGGWLDRQGLQPERSNRFEPRRRPRSCVSGRTAGRENYALMSK